jgi:hypothetical protein
MDAFLEIKQGAMERLVGLFQGCPGMRDIKKVLVRTVRILKVFHKTGKEITSGMPEKSLPDGDPPYAVTADLLSAVHEMKPTVKNEVRLDMYI